MLKLSTFAFRRLGSFRSFRSYSSSAPAAESSSEKINVVNQISEDGVKVDEIKNTGLVAAAFAALHSSINENEVLSKLKVNTKNKSAHSELRKEIDDKINAALDVETLLQLGDNSLISRKQSLKIVSTLADWSSSGKVRLSEFESDRRFLKVCRTLSRQRTPPASVKSEMASGPGGPSHDLSTVLEITGGDEAAKLIANLNLQQMVKVMSSLAQKKRRSTPLLRALAFNITRHAEALDLKRAADVLYAMAILNFPDTVLADRVCSDIQEKLVTNEDKSAVVGSIATSLRLLRYRDVGTLEALAQWAAIHAEVCSSNHRVALLSALGALDYTPVAPLPCLTCADLPPAQWLECVWSLAVLGRASSSQLESILQPDFVSSLALHDGEMHISMRRKLANLRGLCSGDIAGSLSSGMFSLEPSPTYSQDKLVLAGSLQDALRSLLVSPERLRLQCDSGFGFLHDAECLLDSDCNPYPVDHSNEGLLRVALLTLDYRDLCLESTHPIGRVSLYVRLLQAQGYRVLLIPHTEFDPKDKLIKRVQYIENKLKAIVKGDNL